MTVTLIMPTMNRPEFVNRTLSYFRRASAPWPIIVLDGSEPEQASRTAACVASAAAQGGMVTYAPFPGKSFARRLYLGAHQVKTPFMQLIADDDFTSPEFIRAAIDLLDGDSSCAAVRGAMTGFRLSHSSARSQGEPVRFTAIHRPRERTERDPVSRILWFQGERNSSLFYALRRADSWRGIAVDFIRTEEAVGNWQDDATAFMLSNLYEIIQDYSTLIRGSVRSVPHLMMGRQYHANNTGALISRESDHVRILLDSRFSGLAQIAIDAISKGLAGFSGRTPDDERPLAEALFLLRFADRVRFNTDARISDHSLAWAQASRAAISNFKPRLPIRLMQYALFRLEGFMGRLEPAVSGPGYDRELMAIRDAIAGDAAAD